jgi:hypothetical protein
MPREAKPSRWSTRVAARSTGSPTSSSGPGLLPISSDPEGFFDAETVHNVTYEWNHTLGKVISAVSAAGLGVELLHEFDYTKFARWPILEKSGFDSYRLPAGTPRIPLMYSLRARKS